MQARLEPLTEEGRPFRAFAREALAMAQLQHGKTAEARSTLVVLKNSLDTPREISQRAELALASIDDGTASNVPAITEAKSIAAERGHHLEILGYVLGTDLDTPAIGEQIAQLEAAGVTIASSSTNLGLLAREFVAKGDN